MKGITVFETFTDIRDDYIRGAELDACFWAATAPKKEKGTSAFGRFMNSGWGVAIVCALVAVSVMGGIIWAGFHAGDIPPAYSDTATGEVYLTAGTQVVTPESFFASSEVVKGNQSSIACGAGFDGEFTVSPVPALTYVSDLRLHMPSNYTLNAVYVYAPEAPTEALYTFETIDGLKALTAGSYYVALRITNTEGKNEYCNDYAFILLVEGSTAVESDTEITAPEETLRLPLMDEPYEWPTFDPPASRFKMSHQVDSFGLGIYSLTAAYTQVEFPDSTRWCVMEITYGVHSGIGNRITCTLYDPQTKEVISKGMPTMLISGHPSPHTILQLEDGRIIALDTSIQPLDFDSANRFAVMAGVWMWSKIDPDTGEELEEVQLVPTGETWSYTFDLTDPPTAMKGWEYAFASYIYSLTDGEPPTLRVLVDTLFSPGDEVMLPPVIHDSFGEDDTATTGWARLQRIMNGELRPGLWLDSAEIECEKVTWKACSWEITESETDAYADVTEDGRGAPVEPSTDGKG